MGDFLDWQRQRARQLLMVRLPWWLRLFGLQRAPAADVDTAPVPVPQYVDTIPVRPRAHTLTAPAHNPHVHE